MAQHALTENFNAFFGCINPSPTLIATAASEHTTVTGLIENPNGLARLLSPKCFLQGSYRQQTAIHTINDVDIVVLCRLWQPGASGTGGAGGPIWDRNNIFDTIAAPLLADGRYRDKVRYTRSSMCIKVDLGIKLEILPVVYKAGNNDAAVEPFRLFRPETNTWDDGYARRHQEWLSWKNQQTGGNFIPCIKIFKHVNSRFELGAVSFHLECLLFALPHECFTGGPADYISQTFSYISSLTATECYTQPVTTPCGERGIFVPTEWSWTSWQEFHQSAVNIAQHVQMANSSVQRNDAIIAWQTLLGEDFVSQPS